MSNVLTFGCESGVLVTHTFKIVFMCLEEAKVNVVSVIMRL